MSDVKNEARSKWRGILMTLGIPEKHLNGRHGPCPMCGGTDRFRFDNKEGNGTFYCNQCGAGDGISLAMKFRGWDFKEAAKEIRKVIGTAPVEKSRPEMTEEKRRQMLRDLYKGSRPVQAGDEVDRYLTGRGMGEKVYPEALRFHPNARFSRDQSFPTMLAIISDVTGKPVTMHRTFLSDGQKAPVDSPRKIVPGELPNGACVRLGGVVNGRVQASIGIAEGIETALAAMQTYDLPVWAAINATMLEKWEPPAGVEEVTIFADNDRKFAGQKAAYCLAHRLSAKGLTVYVKLPEVPGTDFADIPFPAAGGSNEEAA